ncbi:MAG: hypothetical protein RJA77_788, partial [Pseudomonadota bacterium]
MSFHSHFSRVLISICMGVLTACGGGDDERVVVPSASLQIVGAKSSIPEGESIILIPTFSSGTGTLKAYSRENLSTPISQESVESSVQVSFTPAVDSRFQLDVVYDNKGVPTTLSRAIDLNVTPFDTPSIELSATPNAIDQGQSTTLVPFISAAAGSERTRVLSSVIKRSIPSQPNTALPDLEAQSGVGVISSPSQTTAYVLSIEYIQGGLTKTLEKSVIVSVNPPAAFTRVGNLGSARSGHTATVLNNQRVLITGGTDGTSPLSSAEVYDSGAQSFTNSANEMSSARVDHTATALPNGKVLIVGGSDGSTYLKSAEIFDPVTGTFTPTAEAPLVGRANHNAVLLADGNVLIFGGNHEGTASGLSTELYITASDRFENAGPLSKVRVGSAAVLLNDGRVMVAGGSFPPDFTSNGSSTEIYDPSIALGNGVTTRWIAGPAMVHSRSYPALSKFGSRGEFLIAGGTGSAPSSAEIFNPTTFSFRATGNMLNGRSRHTLSVLANGDILSIGGLLSGTPLTS